MKKTGLFLLALLLLIRGGLLLPARASAEEAWTGEWYAAAVRLRESIYPAEHIDASSSLIFGEDGSVQWLIRGMHWKGSWQETPEKDGRTVSFPGLELRAELEAQGVLALIREEMTLLYIRERTGILPAFRPTEAEGIRSFAGKWKLAYYEIENDYVSAKDPEYDVAGGLVIEDGQASFLLRIADYVCPQYDAPVSFSEGRLSWGPADYDSLEIRESVLTEGGLLFLPLRDRAEEIGLGTVLNLYFSRAEGNP